MTNKEKIEKAAGLVDSKLIKLLDDLNVKIEKNILNKSAALELARFYNLEDEVKESYVTGRDFTDTDSEAWIYALMECDII